MKYENENKNKKQRTFNAFFAFLIRPQRQRANEKNKKNYIKSKSKEKKKRNKVKQKKSIYIDRNSAFSTMLIASSQPTDKITSVILFYLRAFFSRSSEGFVETTKEREFEKNDPLLVNVRKMN